VTPDIPAARFDLPPDVRILVDKTPAQ
jgi:hypothetical protein